MYDELGANMLAREWARKGNHFFQAWIDSVGAERFEDENAHPYEFSPEFLEWSADVDIDSPAFARISELRNFVPCAA